MQRTAVGSGHSFRVEGMFTLERCHHELAAFISRGTIL